MKNVRDINVRNVVKSQAYVTRKTFLQSELGENIIN